MIDKKLRNLLSLVDAKSIKKDQYALRSYESSGLYWGYNWEGYLTFGIISNLKDNIAKKQSKKFLELNYNLEFTPNYEKESLKMHLITLKSNDEKFISIFTDISKVFEFEHKNVDEVFLQKFYDLEALFKNQIISRNIETKGLYGELATILYFNDELDFNLTRYYQKIEKDLFDFNISNKKKIEVKTTSNNTRDHVFKFEQLNAKKFDIFIVSIVLKTNFSNGTSLLELMELCKKIKNVDNDFIEKLEEYKKVLKMDELESTIFDYQDVIDSIKFYQANKIPRIQEVPSEGVHDVIFNSDLSNIENTEDDEIISWIKSE